MTSVIDDNLSKLEWPAFLGELFRRSEHERTLIKSPSDKLFFIFLFYFSLTKKKKNGEAKKEKANKSR